MSVDPLYGAAADRVVRERLIEDPLQGWRYFVEHYTPTLLTIIERAGIRREDEAMDIYVRVCEHLSANDCARLRRHDPAKGRLAAWLTVVVRRTIVDWVRSRKGRRRLFQSIRELGALDRRVFDLYYWRGRQVHEIAEVLGAPLSDVFSALERVEHALSQRQRSELVSMAVREREPVPLEDGDGRLVADPHDTGVDPESALRGREAAGALTAALAQLPAEDALIISMRFLDGLSHAQVERALHIRPLTTERIDGILARLRALLGQQGIDHAAIGIAGLAADGGGVE